MSKFAFNNRLLVDIEILREIVVEPALDVVFCTAGFVNLNDLCIPTGGLRFVHNTLLSSNVENF